MEHVSPGLALEGRHALITGAGGGIGSAIAAALSAAGARVTLAGRKREPLEAAAALCIGETYLAEGFDITDELAIAGGVAAARAALGPISILINNAGEAPSAPFEKTSLSQWNAVLSLNLTGTFSVTQAVLPDLRVYGAGARILNIASTAGLKGYSYVSAYCAAKHGLIGLTRALAVELMKTGITVNAICPGYTETPLVHGAMQRIEAKTGRSQADILAEFAKSNPQGRLIQPSEVAHAALWLISSGASSMTGQAITVAGGEIMG